jgi:hypothetical protein
MGPSSDIFSRSARKTRRWGWDVLLAEPIDACLLFDQSVDLRLYRFYLGKDAIELGKAFRIKQTRYQARRSVPSARTFYGDGARYRVSFFPRWPNQIWLLAGQGFWIKAGLRCQP